MYAYIIEGRDLIIKVRKSRVKISFVKEGAAQGDNGASIAM